MSQVPTPQSGTAANDLPSANRDHRLYVPHAEGWVASVKKGWDNEYCFRKNPGEDFFHLLMCGEIHLQRGDAKYCLRCAIRDRIATEDRSYWQRREEHPKPAFPDSGET